MDCPHLRIAVTTNSLIQCDANFVLARQVVFFDVTSDRSEFVDVVHFSKSGKKGPGGGQGKKAGSCVMDDQEDDDGSGRDPLVERVEALKGCSVLFTMGLSDLAAVRLHAEKVFPVKSERVRDIDDVIANVQSLMAAKLPPLWVRRALRGSDGRRLAMEDRQEVY
ncbi:NifB/NifX family molybdenum-iron cluster-binding protein [Magnetospirillum sulfuroxidans]|uniref:Nitrogen fixation protein n=1 Tax=Magnetospirillum sulfuroxidans TaxID=611300 RepID=A0ABS5IG66_9PROT|nr:NifB/NifX family molybdenum-iron cluster-binding protein [Magnetospirillum sulfuroxidans]MBR9973423.1 nitrogen fixation protein [Magnetospirillum sulfuroxidans]